jgi:hypothetical protein
MAAQKRSTRTKLESTRRRGQAIAIGMLAQMKRAIDKDCNTLADLCALQNLPAGKEQENIVLSICSLLGRTTMRNSRPAFARCSRDAWRKAH